MNRQRGLGLIALVVAIGCALGTGFFAYAQLTPARPQHVLTPGQSVEVDGVRFRLDSFSVAETLPAQEAADPPVRGPAGTMIVLVVVSQTVTSRSVRLDEHFCDVTLVAEPSGARSPVWKPETDFTYGLRRPTALGCGDTSSNPLAYDLERPMGFSFVVPATAAGDVAGELSTDDGRTVIGLRR